MSASGCNAQAVPFPLGERLIRIREVAHMTGLGRSTIYKKMSEGSFPQAVHLGQRFTAWTHSSIMDWLQSVIAGEKNFSPK